MPLEEDTNIPSIDRLDRLVVLEPDHIHKCVGKTRIRNAYGDSYQTEQLTPCYLSDLYGISVPNEVVTLDQSRNAPILIMNNTNPTISFKWGCPVAKLNRAADISGISGDSTPN